MLSMPGKIANRLLVQTWNSSAATSVRAWWRSMAGSCRLCAVWEPKNMKVMSATDAANATALEWQPNTIRFRYSLSYVKLFELAFRALQDTRPFDPERPVISGTQP